ncbi:MAG TPA: SIMPL domain-containing protein [Chthoniobacterales bacterium]|nr:SIMPL domain-containing protein [Chthoniobacterales bacterium]
MKRLLFSLVILPISLFAEGGLPDKPYIYVQGKAEIEKAPDMVTIKFDVVARAPDESKANEEVQAKAIKIFDLFNNAKIAKEDVIAQSLESEPQFEQGEKYIPNHGKLVGYEVSRPFEVKIRDIAAFPKLVDELIAVGGIEFSSSGGGLTKQKEVEEQLADKALTNARERADKTAKAMGVKIESVFAISAVPFAEVHNSMFPSERVTVTGSNIPTARSRTPEYRFAPITVSQEIHVIYLISSAK